MSDELELNPKDCAEYLWLMLQLDLTNNEGVIGWADSLIESSPEPKPWMRDLSVCAPSQSQEIRTLLQSVPGQITNDAPRKMVIAVLREKWLTQVLSDEQFASCGLRCIPITQTIRRNTMPRRSGSIWMK